MPLKIILVHNSYQQPGGEDVVFDQELQMLERAGHQVVVYRRSNNEIENLSAVGRLALMKNIVWSSSTRQEFSKVLHEERPQLVHVHNTFLMVSPSIYSACQEADIPVVQTLHNFRFACPGANFFRNGKVCEECLEDGLWRSVQHGCYRSSRVATAACALMLGVHRWLGTWSDKVDSFVALTQFSRQKLIAAGLPADQIHVKPNFVLPDPGRKCGDGEYALFVGRLSPEKGAKTLLSAWEQLPSPIPLHIVGDGPLRLEMEETIEKRGLANVHMHGQLSHAGVTSALKNARFLILSSECYENFPMTVAEAFSCGTPVLCSRLGAMQEIVTDGRTGIHFSPGEPADLAAKVRWAWGHPEEIAAMGRLARLEYESKYTEEKNHSRLMEIYHEAIVFHRQLARRQPVLPAIPSSAD
jgi:glycosyltransferase involved in cell wall biosynthesis